LLDSEYGKASYVNKTKDIEGDCLIGIRSNCCWKLAAVPRQIKVSDKPKGKLVIGESRWGTLWYFIHDYNAQQSKGLSRHHYYRITTQN
jgi:hypothetical protein